MRHGGKLMVGLTLNVALVAGAPARVVTPTAAVVGGPYHAITDRNIFGLAHPELNPATNAPPAPPPNVKLVGLLQVSGRPQGVFAITEPGPGAKPAVNFILGTDERQEGVEVLALDIGAKSAKIQVGENVSVIKLEEPKPVTTGIVVGALPSGMGPGGRPLGFPPGRPGGVVPPIGFNNQPTYNNPSLPGAFNPGASVEPNAAMGGDGGSLPNRAVRSDAQQQQQISAEQQMYNMEIQRAAALEAGSPIANLLPITPMTPPQAIQQMNGVTPDPTPTQPSNPSLSPTQQPVFGTRVTGKYLLPGGQ